MSWWDLAKKLWETKFGKFLVGSVSTLGLAIFLRERSNAIIGP